MDRNKLKEEKKLYNKNADSGSNKGKQMKIKLKKTINIEPGHIILSCNKADHAYVLDLIQQFNNHLIKIKVKDQRERYQLISIDDIFYVEVVNTKVFVYTKNLVYEYKGKFKKLYQNLHRFCFAQINRNTLVNINKIDAIEILPQCHRAITLKNKEVIIANRKYKNNIKI